MMVERSDLQSSPEYAERQIRQLLSDHVYQRLTAAGQLDPSHLAPFQLAESDQLMSLVRDRFVQQLAGPAGEPVWREAMLVHTGLLSESNELTRWVHEIQHASHVAEHDQRQHRRHVAGQILVVLGGISGLYGLLNAFTRGYFVGRLRLLAVVAAVIALLGFIMIG
jgi:hypothetical protein